MKNETKPCVADVLVTGTQHFLNTFNTPQVTQPFSHLLTDLLLSSFDPLQKSLIILENTDG